MGANGTSTIEENKIEKIGYTYFVAVHLSM
jgi:hypothetical protein